MIEVTLRVFRADGFSSRARGLIGRRAPGPGCGLWLRPCRLVHTLGMAYAIDVVFLDPGSVVLEVAGVRPWRLSPWVGGAQSVVELAAGEAARLGIAPGVKVNLIAEEISCYDQ